MASVVYSSFEEPGNEEARPLLQVTAYASPSPVIAYGAAESGAFAVTPSGGTVAGVVQLPGYASDVIVESVEGESYATSAADSPAASNVREWAVEFYQLMAMKDNSPAKFLGILHLAQDFEQTALMYGRIIISELFLPNEQKTIRPVSVGGVAGGDKYIVNGIFFKVAYDFELTPNLWMYGGLQRNDDYAMKASAHELRSALKIFQAPGKDTYAEICLPLICLIDYRGFRLFCSSVLPIHGAHTLVYGSGDGGQTVFNGSEFFGEKATTAKSLRKQIKHICQWLNLKKHLAGVGFAKKLYGPGDMEAHIAADGKCYLLDLARLFPPEAPLDESLGTRSVFYYLLRPEFVKSNPVPLCSDAFTNWQSTDPERQTHNDELCAATERLRGVVIPDLARALDQRFAAREEACSTEPINVVIALHQAGVNLRHLGLVYEHAARTDTRSALLMEMTVRVYCLSLKNALREHMRALRVSSDEPYKQLIVSFVNKMLSGMGPEGTPDIVGQLRWLKNEIEMQYRTAVRAVDEKLLLRMDFKEMLPRFAAKSGIRLSPRIYASLKVSPVGFAPHIIAVGSDIEATTAVAKSLDIVNLAEANALFLDAQQLRQQNVSQEMSLLLVARNKYLRVLESGFDDAFVHFRLGMTYSRLALYSTLKGTLGLDPGTLAHALLNTEFSTQKMFRCAIESFEKCISFGECVPAEVHTEFAFTLCDTLNFARSQAQFRAAIRKDVESLRTTLQNLLESVTNSSQLCLSRTLAKLYRGWLELVRDIDDPQGSTARHTSSDVVSALLGVATSLLTIFAHNDDHMLEIATEGEWQDMRDMRPTAYKRCCEAIERATAMDPARVEAFVRLHCDRWLRRDDTTIHFLSWIVKVCRYCVSDHFASMLRRCMSALECIDLYSLFKRSCDVDAADLSTLFALCRGPALRRLYWKFFGSANDYTDVLTLLIECLPNLESIDFDGKMKATLTPLFAAVAEGKMPLRAMTIRQAREANQFPKVPMYSLRQLRLCDSYIDSSIINPAITSTIQYCTSLTHIELDELNAVNDSCIVAMCTTVVAGQLEVLRIRGGAVTDVGVQAVCSTCTNLHTLGLQNLSKLTASAVNGFVLTKLERLCISNSFEKRIDAVFTAIAPTLQLLRDLRIDAVPLSSVGADAIATHCTQLHRLRIAGCNQLVLGNSLGSLQRLYHLDLTESRSITDDDLEMISAHLTQLRELSVHGVSKVTHLGLSSVLTGCALQKLSIDGCFSVDTAQAFASLPASLVFLSCASRVTDDDILHVATRCPALQVLNVAQSIITDFSLMKLAEGCHELRLINISSCRHITQVGISLLVAGCPHLQLLQVENLAVPVEVFTQLKLSAPQLKFHYVTRTVSNWEIPFDIFEDQQVHT